MEIALLPKYLLRWVSKRNLNEIHFNILLSNIIIVCLAIAFGNMSFVINKLPHLCLSRAIFHIDCPGCGITTGLLRFFNLNFRAAYDQNPVSILAGSFFIIQIIIRFMALVKNKLSSKVFYISSILNGLLITALFSHFVFKLFHHNLN